MPSPETDKYSPSYVTERQPLGRVLPLAAPYLVLLDASEACNFKCAYCFRGDEAAAARQSGRSYARAGRLMTWETFTRAVDQLLEFTAPVKKISLSGHGEPLVNRRLPQMVRYIKDRGLTCPVEIHTNGSLLDEDFADDLADSGIDRVILSIQGVNAEAYRKNAGVGLDFDLFLRRLARFHQRRRHTLVYAKTVDACLAPGEEDLFVDIFAQVADRVFIEKALPLWKGQENQAPGPVNKFNQAVARLHCCSLVFYTLLVAPDGAIHPCTQPEIAFDLGNVGTTTLSAAWNSPTRRDFLIRHLRDGREALPDCADCYIAQNSIMTEDDLIDQYRGDILRRMREE